MPKFLRLFLKDVRHLWPEILLSVLLTAGFAATQYLTWPAFRYLAFRESESLAIWVVALMILSWCLLIARAVHDESLVGNRQFWVTRPYGWASILGSKILFILLFILLPFFLAQCSLLHRAGLYPTHVLPSLLATLGLIFLFLALPMLAVSTITSGIGRIILIALGLAVYAGIVTYLSEVFLINPLWRPHDDFRVCICYLFLLMPIVCAAVVVVQYALRRTGIAIALLLVLVAGATALMLMGTKSRWLDRSVPTLGVNEQPPAQFALDAPLPEPPLSNPLDSYRNPSDAVLLRIPLQVSVAPGHAIVIVGTQQDWTLRSQADGSGVSIPGGMKDLWTSRGFTGYRLQGDLVKEEVEIPRNDFNAIPNFDLKLSLHLTYAVKEFEPVGTSIVLAANTIDIPENGHCVPLSGQPERWSLVHADGTELTCMYAGREPSLTRVQYHLRPNCSANASLNNPGLGYDHSEWVGDDSSAPQFVLSGVAINGPGLVTLALADGPPLHLCPGEPITFTRFRFVRERIISIDLPPFDPRPYVTHRPENRFAD